jgi:hypothetical protein
MCSGPIPQQPTSYAIGECLDVEELESNAERSETEIGDMSPEMQGEADDWGELW